MLLLIILIILLAAYGVCIFYYHKEWLHTKVFAAAADSTPATFATVLIAARNEAQALPGLLGDLARQSYPSDRFEVIVIDDYSTDETATIVEGPLHHLRVIQPDVPAHASSKKAAIATGVQHAKGELIIITDADCRVQPEWIAQHVFFYQQHGSAFIAAPVQYQHDGSLFQIFQSLDFMTLQGITAASVHANFHDMCNGANLSYTKKAFEEVNGFSGIDHVASGDDMLLMHKIRKKHADKVHYLKSKEAIVYTAPMGTWKEFINQRRRWASKTLVYQDRKIIAVLSLVLLLNIFFFILLMAAVMNPSYWWLVLTFVMVKTLIELPFVYSIAKFYKESTLVWYFILLQPLHIFYTAFIGLLSQTGRYNWKGRTVR